MSNFSTHSFFGTSNNHPFGKLLITYYVKIFNVVYERPHLSGFHIFLGLTWLGSSFKLRTLKCTAACSLEQFWCND